MKTIEKTLDWSCGNRFWPDMPDIRLLSQKLTGRTLVALCGVHTLFESIHSGSTNSNMSEPNFLSLNFTIGFSFHFLHVSFAWGQRERRIVTSSTSWSNAAPCHRFEMMWTWSRTMETDLPCLRSPCLHLRLAHLPRYQDRVHPDTK